MAGRNIFHTDEKLKKCPFCGSEVGEISNIGNIPMFSCKNYRGCGALVSFDNKLCNANPGSAKRFFNRRGKEE